MAPFFGPAWPIFTHAQPTLLPFWKNQAQPSLAYVTLCPVQPAENRHSSSSAYLNTQFSLASLLLILILFSVHNNFFLMTNSQMQL